MLTFFTEAQWHSLKGDFTVSAEAIILYNEFYNHIFKITVMSPRSRWIDIKWNFKAYTHHVQTDLSMACSDK